MFKNNCFAVVLAAVSLFISFNAIADKSQIIEDVLSEKGFYDAHEIEKRLRFKA